MHNNGNKETKSFVAQLASPSVSNGVIQDSNPPPQLLMYPYTKKQKQNKTKPMTKEHLEKHNHLRDGQIWTTLHLLLYADLDNLHVEQITKILELYDRYQGAYL